MVTKENTFIRNVILYGEKKGLCRELADCLKQESSKVETSIISDKNEVSSLVGSHDFQAIFVRSENIKDIQYITKIFSMYRKKNDSVNMYFTTSEFSVFQEIVKTMGNIAGVHLIPWPIKVVEVANKILDELYNRKLTQQIVTKDGTKLNVDLEFIKVFIDASKMVLGEMGVVDITHSKPAYKDQFQDKIEAGISSRIVINSPHFKGSFYIVFPSSTFLTLYEMATFEKHSEVNDSNQDFAGEIANIVYGNAKKIFSTSGLNLDMVIPSVHRSTKIVSEIVIYVPFNSSIGEFYIGVAPGAIF